MLVPGIFDTYDPRNIPLPQDVPVHIPDEAVHSQMLNLYIGGLSTYSQTYLDRIATSLADQSTPPDEIFSLMNMYSDSVCADIFGSTPQDGSPVREPVIYPKITTVERSFLCLYFGLIINAACRARIEAAERTGVRADDARAILRKLNTPVDQSGTTYFDSIVQDYRMMTREEKGVVLRELGRHLFTLIPGLEDVIRRVNTEIIPAKEASQLPEHQKGPAKLLSGIPMDESLNSYTGWKGKKLPAY